MTASAGLILASGSAARREMLTQAGVSFAVQPADIDEEALKASLEALPPAELASELAKAKARAVSKQQPKAWVLGSDQVLEFDGQLISKARSLAEAEARLKSMRGRSHRLISSVSLARDGQIVWTATDQAVLNMRAFSDAFLARYLETEGPQALASVGSYRLEGPGAQLFSTIEGDYFTILGMPLWPVLAALRDVGALPS